jgi:hypothetical protein
VYGPYTRANLSHVNALERRLSRYRTAQRTIAPSPCNLRTRAIPPRSAPTTNTRLFALSALLSTLAAGGLPAARARAAQVLPIAFQIAAGEAQPVVTPEFVAERVARANQIFAAYDVQFVAAATAALAGEHAVIETAADRDVLGANVRRGVINCFVVGSLRDVDDPTQMRRGVHWHSRAYPGTHYVVLSSIAGPDVLAHELGHFLGNPKHSDTPGNLMSYQRTEALPFLDAAQALRVQRSVRAYLRTGELHPFAERHAGASRQRSASGSGLREPASMAGSR